MFYQNLKDFSVFGDLYKMLLKRKVPQLLKKNINNLKLFCSKIIEPVTDIDSVPDKVKMDPSVLKVHTHKYNYNFEENRKYKQIIQKALEQRDFLKEARLKNFPSKRSQVIYDRPKFDNNLKNYEVYREFGELTFVKDFPHEFKVVFKLEISPRIMLQVFGNSVDASRNMFYSTKEWDFIDTNFDKFLIYDYKSCTSYWGENETDEWYEENQRGIPRMRKYKQPSEKEFWESDTPHPFRVNCTKYAEWPKFRKWILREIEEKQGETYESRMKRSIGDFNIMDNYDKKYKVRTTCPLFKYNREQLHIGKKKWKPWEVEDFGFQPKERLDDKYLIKFNN